jgi:hypothetical protein
MVASSFFFIYDLTMDTILICYCYDMVHVDSEHFFSGKLDSRVKQHKELYKPVVKGGGFAELTEKGVPTPSAVDDDDVVVDV